MRARHLMPMVVVLLAATAGCASGPEFRAVPEPVAPTIDGAVDHYLRVQREIAEARAEWSLGAWEVSATFDLGARNVRLHATHLDTDASEAAEMSLTSEGALDTFVRFVRQISPTARGS